MEKALQQEANDSLKTFAVGRLKQFGYRVAISTVVASGIYVLSLLVAK
ncbi:hypothetical protein [Priestia koreensis]|nr:hypothetical protein [Priestia koreensis]